MKEQYEPKLKQMALLSALWIIANKFEEGEKKITVDDGEYEYTLTRKLIK